MESLKKMFSSFKGLDWFILFVTLLNIGFSINESKNMDIFASVVFLFSYMFIVGRNTVLGTKYLKAGLIISSLFNATVIILSFNYHTLWLALTSGAMIALNYICWRAESMRLKREQLQQENSDDEDTKDQDSL